MKRFLTVYSIFCCTLFSQLKAQTDESGKSYYVVIGAFTYEQNAKILIEWAKKLELNPQYKLNVDRKLYYVYTKQYDNWGIPVQEAERLRKLSPTLDETWVYYGTLDGIVVTENSTNSEGGSPVVQEESIKTESSVATDLKPETTSDTPQPQAEVDDSKHFFFKLYVEDGKLIKAPVEVVDLDKSSLASIYPSNEKIAIKPVNESGRIMVQSKVFGYRLRQVGVDFTNPTDSAGIVLDSGIYQVPLELKPLVEGDVAIMYNVFFYKDAGIMRPDSKYEINALVAMMQEFPHRKIIIHGHTNGTHRGKIIKLGDSKNFFSQEGSTTYLGTATELSKVRAETIMEYLVTNGIEKHRMTIKAWGGKKPLFDSDGPRAIDNVRVEVEIAKH